ncbi:hypothetical protein [Actinoplanes sp. NPDC026623]|uniref:hypothetical protein n=1 Tax=Actinoplanes sp. NPDC026623 TaxID=3155610 RepID=UPI003404C4A9
MAVVRSGRRMTATTSAEWISKLPRVGLGSVVGRLMILQSPSHIRTGDLIVSGGEKYRVSRVDPAHNEVIEVHLAYAEDRRSIYVHASSAVRVVRAKRRRKPPAPSAASPAVAP